VLLDYSPIFTSVMTRPSYCWWHFVDTIEVEKHLLMHHFHHSGQMMVNVRAAIIEKIDYCFSHRMTMMSSSDIQCAWYYQVAICCFKWAIHSPMHRLIDFNMTDFAAQKRCFDNRSCFMYSSNCFTVKLIIFLCRVRVKTLAL
jgi:hypothetical protein